MLAAGSAVGFGAEGQSRAAAALPWCTGHRAALPRAQRENRHGSFCRCAVSAKGVSLQQYDASVSKVKH